VFLKEDRQLANHIKESGFPDDTWLTKWMISFFSGYFSPYYSARFLDFIFSRDIFVIPILCMSIVISIRKKILATDMEGINFLFQNFLHLDQP
jgi:hypothetical protein